MTLIFLLIAFQVKHFLCDYPLQGRYMLGKFKPYPGFILPLLAHSAVHALFTFSIVILFNAWTVALGLALFDMIAHFVVDRIKASPKMLGRFKALSSREYVAMTSHEDHPHAIITFDNCPPNYAEITQDQKQIYLKSNTFFWWALGADQMMHHLTHYIIILAILI